MNALMLEGWTPILLLGIVVAIVIFVISRKLSRKVLFSITIVLSFICIGTAFYSLFGVGGWSGMGLMFYANSVFLGGWLGTLIGAINKNERV